MALRLMLSFDISDNDNGGLYTMHAIYQLRV